MAGEGHEDEHQGGSAAAGAVGRGESGPLATTCADLLEWHSQKLTREIKAFDSELKVVLLLSSYLHVAKAGVGACHDL